MSSSKSWRGEEALDVCLKALRDMPASSTAEEIKRHENTAKALEKARELGKADYKMVVYDIEKWIKKGESSIDRLVGVILIDIICRDCRKHLGKEKDFYSPRFGTRLADIFGLLSILNERDTSIVRKLTDEWTPLELFPMDKIQQAIRLLKAPSTLSSSSSKPHDIGSSSNSNSSISANNNLTSISIGSSVDLNSKSMSSKPPPPPPPPGARQVNGSTLEGSSFMPQISQLYTSNVNNSNDNSNNSSNNNSNRSTINSSSTSNKKEAASLYKRKLPRMCPYDRDSCPYESSSCKYMHSSDSLVYFPTLTKRSRSQLYAINNDSNDVSDSKYIDNSNKILNQSIIYHSLSLSEMSSIGNLDIQAAINSALVLPHEESATGVKISVGNNDQSGSSSTASISPSLLVSPSSIDYTKLIRGKLLRHELTVPTIASNAGVKMSCLSLSDANAILSTL